MEHGEAVAATATFALFSALLPSIHEVPENRGLVRRGELYATGLSLLVGLYVSARTNSNAPIAAAGLFSLGFVAIYEHACATTNYG